RPGTFVTAPSHLAAIETSKHRLSRDFRRGSIFDFCNTICQKRSLRLLANDGALVARQGNDELGKCFGLGLDSDLAAMLLDNDVMSHGKAKPCSFPCRLSGEKGNENLFLYLRWDAGAVVANADFNCGAEIPRGRAEDRFKAFFARFSLSPGCGIEAVGNQVEQRPSDLLRIQFGCSCVGVEIVSQ